MIKSSINYLKCELIYYIHVPLKWLRLTIQSVNKDVEQLDLSYIAVKNFKGTATLENYGVVS